MRKRISQVVVELRSWPFNLRASYVMSTYILSTRRSESACSIFEILSAWDHGDFDAICSGKGEVYVFDPFCGIAIFYAAELLEEADDGVARFCQGELLTNAYTWTTIEWQICPPRAETLFWCPSFRSEIEGIRPVDVFSSVHGVHAICDKSSFCDVDWREAVWSSSSWKCCVSKSCSGVAGNHGV